MSVDEKTEDQSRIVVPSLIRLNEKVEMLSDKESRATLQKHRSEFRSHEKKGNIKSAGWSMLQIAMILRGQHKFEEAIRFLKEARYKFSNLNDNHSLAYVLLELSICHREFQRNALALEYGKEAIQIFERLENHEELPWAYRNIALIYVNLHRNHEALMYAEKARSIFINQDSHSGIAWSGCILTTLFYDMGRFQQGLRYAHESLEVFEKLKNQPGKAWALLWLGLIYRELSQNVLAENYLVKSRKIYTTLDLKDRVGWCLLSEAAVLRIRGENEKAMNLNKQALHIFLPLKNQDGIAWSLFQVGKIYRDQGQFVKAWESFKKALAVNADFSNWKGLAWTQNEFGCIYLDLAELSRAEEAFKKSSEMLKILGENPLKVEINRNMSRLYMEKGEIGIATTLLHQSEALSTKLNTIDLNLKVLLDEVRCALIIGQSARAMGLLKRAEILADKHSLGHYQPAIQSLMAETLIAKKKVDQAIQAWTRAYKTAKKMGLLRDLFDILIGLVQTLVYHKKGDARHYLRELDHRCRAMNSKKLRAKYLFVKAWVDFHKNKKITAATFDKAIRMANDVGLVLHESHMLSAYRDIARKAKHENYLKECEKKLESIRLDHKKGFQKFSNRDVFVGLPISPNL